MVVDRGRIIYTALQREVLPPQTFSNKDPTKCWKDRIQATVLLPASSDLFYTQQESSCRGDQLLTAAVSSPAHSRPSCLPMILLESGISRVVDPICPPASDSRRSKVVSNKGQHFIHYVFPQRVKFLTSQVDSKSKAQSQWEMSAIAQRHLTWTVVFHYLPQVTSIREIVGSNIRISFISSSLLFIGLRCQHPIIISFCWAAQLDSSRGVSDFPCFIPPFLTLPHRHNPTSFQFCCESSSRDQPSPSTMLHVTSILITYNSKIV